MTRNCQLRAITAARWNGSECVVQVEGDIDLDSSADFQQGLLEVLDGRPMRLVVDLAGVPYMDSSGVASLVKVLSRIRRYGGSLCLVGLSQRVRSIFEITHLDAVFEIRANGLEA